MLKFFCIYYLFYLSISPMRRAAFGDTFAFSECLESAAQGGLKTARRVDAENGM